VAAIRSRHGTERSQARSTTYAPSDRLWARAIALAAEGSLTESTSTTCEMSISESTASS
jgi:hypothetical protein